MYRHILIPLDGSPLAEQALNQIPHLAAEGAQVTLVQVVRAPLPIVAPEMAVPIPAAGLEEVKIEAAAYLQAQAAALAARPIAANIDVIEGNDVAQSLVAYAKDHGSDVIVMSTHGRGGLSRLVFGSAAEEVVRHAPCPVLVIRPS